MSNSGIERLPSEFFALINSLGLSQEEACQLFSVRKKTVRQWIYNHTSPPLAVVEEVRLLALKHIQRISHIARCLDDQECVFFCSRTEEEAAQYGWLSLSNERHALSSVCALRLLNGYSLPKIQYRNDS